MGFSPRSFIRLLRKSGAFRVLTGKPSIESKTIRLLYSSLLFREATEPEVDAWLKQFSAGLSLEEFIWRVKQSPEAQPRNDAGAVLQHLTDELFIAHVFEIFLDMGARTTDIRDWTKALRGGMSRAEMMRILFTQYLEHLDRSRDVARTDKVRVAGTDVQLSLEAWDERRKQIQQAGSAPTLPVCPEVRAPRSEGIKVSAIASLYRGGNYIEKFLENIGAQTLGEQFELIIIDANSPENESEAIRRFQATHPNVVYKRMDYRIGIYDAWNVGVEMARGKYITNTNLDDLRHPCSLALQAAALDQLPFVDVVYQDFYYSLDHDLDFDEVAAFGFKSNLPIVMPVNLLHFNSPHNAPMWRKTLHTEMGLFDTSLKSAGDHDFWLRCALAGKTFYKLNFPHVAYYQNPQGVSTRPDSPGRLEGPRLIKKYARQLLSPLVYGGRERFMNHLDDLAGGKSFASNDDTLYEIAAGKLLELAGMTVR